MGAQNPAANSTEGNPGKRSKEYLEAKAASEISLGSTKFKMPADLKGDDIAVKKWRDLMKLYKDCPYITTADTDAISEYCKMFSEISLLEKTRTQIIKDKQNDGATLTEIHILLVSIKIDIQINKKREMINKLRIRLLIDPTARVRAVPISNAPKEKESDGLSQFGDI